MVRGLVFGMGLLLAALVQAQEQAALAVEVAQAARVAHERSLAADGVVVARELAAVNAQVAGVSLARLEADIGDRVQAGQVLARFDAALLQQELAQAQAQEARWLRASWRSCGWVMRRCVRRWPGWSRRVRQRSG